ncbi:DUF4026 domain-containing protein [bacterium]|nr:DUF4026 domain-containing protein [bacterium]
MESPNVIPPSSLLILWPGDHPPMAEEVRVRLAEWGQTAPEMGSEGPEETLWSFWLELAERPTSFFVWCERVSDTHKMLLDYVHWRSPEQRRQATQCLWMVGLEGPISMKEPTADYQLQLRLCEAISRDWSPVIFDASALVYRSADDIRLLTEAQTPPRKSSLFSIHKVRSTPEGAVPASYWVHTHGLERAGIPDLEILSVPQPLLGASCELLDAVADLWIEFGTPDAEISFAIGNSLEIAWRPWQAMAAELGTYDVGGREYRGPQYGHCGLRAVLVEPNQTPEGRVVWEPPISLLRRVSRAETTLYKTVQESKRMARLARERWGVFGILFASPHPESWRFAIKLNFPMDDDPRHGEHLWFDVVGIRPGEVLGRLVSIPSHVKRQSLSGTTWHELKKLSDWRIVTPAGVFDPENAAALLEERSALSMA